MTLIGTVGFVGMDYGLQQKDCRLSANFYHVAVLDSSFHAFIRLKGLQETRVVTICQNEAVGMTVE